jgi:ferredoxin--NADP+ reductase
MMAKWIQGTVIDNIHWTENLFSLKIDADVDSFSAGQFTSLALDVGGKRVARPYSYLSSPDQQPIEFFFYTAVDGVLSNAMVKLKVGDSIWVRQQANGFFVLDEVPSADELWMLGTGTGVAPFFSILHTELAWQRFQRIVLVHAVRTEEDLRYQELVQGLREKYPDRFLFQAFVSREVCSGTITGRVPAAIADGSLENTLGLQLDTRRSQIMLCGNPDMVKDCTETLKARGFTKNRRRTPGHITAENYW